jgi:hypothetical protein
MSIEPQNKQDRLGALLLRRRNDEFWPLCCRYSKKLLPFLTMSRIVRKFTTF